MARALGKVVIAADAIWPQYPLASLSDVNVISKVWLQTNFPIVFDYDHSLDLQAHGTGVVIVTDGAKPVLVVRGDSSAFGVEPYEIAHVVDTSGARRPLRRESPTAGCSPTGHWNSRFSSPAPQQGSTAAAIGPWIRRRAWRMFSRSNPRETGSRIANYLEIAFYSAILRLIRALGPVFFA